MFSLFAGDTATDTYATYKAQLLTAIELLALTQVTDKMSAIWPCCLPCCHPSIHSILTSQSHCSPRARRTQPAFPIVVLGNDVASRDKGLARQLERWHARLLKVSTLTGVACEGRLTHGDKFLMSYTKLHVLNLTQVSFQVPCKSQNLNGNSRVVGIARRADFCT